MKNKKIDGRNQCQGCQDGWETISSKLGDLHLVEGGYEGEKVACTKSIYESREDAIEIPKHISTVDELIGFCKENHD